MLRILYSTVSYPVMNLILTLDAQAKVKESDEYKQYVKEQTALRYKRIVMGRPYQPIFS